MATTIITLLFSVIAAHNYEPSSWECGQTVKGTLDDRNQTRKYMVNLTRDATLYGVFDSCQSTSTYPIVLTLYNYENGEPSNALEFSSDHEEQCPGTHDWIYSRSIFGYNLNDSDYLPLYASRGYVAFFLEVGSRPYNEEQDETSEMSGEYAIGWKCGDTDPEYIWHRSTATPTSVTTQTYESLSWKCGETMTGALDHRNQTRTYLVNVTRKAHATLYGVFDSCESTATYPIVLTLYSSVHEEIEFGAYHEEPCPETHDWIYSRSIFAYNLNNSYYGPLYASEEYLVLFLGVSSRPYDEEMDETSEMTGEYAIGWKCGDTDTEYIWDRHQNGSTPTPTDDSEKQSSKSKSSIGGTMAVIVAIPVVILCIIVVVLYFNFVRKRQVVSLGRTGGGNDVEKELLSDI